MRKRIIQGIKDYFGRRTRVRRLILVSFVLIITAILPSNHLLNYEYEIGKPWDESDVIAPFDFPILKADKDLRKERDKIKENTPEILIEIPSKVAENKAAFNYYFDLLIRAIELRIENQKDAELTEIISRLNPAIDKDKIITVGGKLLRYRPVLFALLDSIYKIGYSNRAISDIKSEFVSLRSTASRESLRKKEQLLDAKAVYAIINQRLGNHDSKVIMQQVVTHFLTPNYQYDEELYTQELKTAMSSISKYYGKVKAGQKIIGKGEIVTHETRQMLHSLHVERHKSDFVNSFLFQIQRSFGHLILVSLLTFITVLFLRISYGNKDVYRRNRKLTMLFSIYLFMAIISVVTQALTQKANSIGYDVNINFMVPLCMAPIMVTIFFDDKIGFFSNIIVGLLVGIVFQNSFEFFFIQMCAGSITVFRLNVLRRRSQFFETAGILLLCYLVTYFGYNLYLKGNVTDINYVNMFLFIINVSFTLGTYPLIYLFEKIFNITSDLTYMELLYTDHPLLKELALKAPGTYQHSLQVANISEAVAKKIGANALQVHIGALFHDIGKLSHPEYFTENQHNDKNPHDYILPIQSAEIIIRHVSYGEELARKNKLPNEIIDFIRTHHGTSRVEYFYRKHLDINGLTEMNDRTFRYLGPRPTSKEMAILMIADSIEAASHSLTNPAPDELENLVDSIITHKINDDQLGGANITFKDVTIMKKEITKLLISIYHSRVKYPQQLGAKI